MLLKSGPRNIEAQNEEKYYCAGMGSKMGSKRMEGTEIQKKNLFLRNC